MISIQGMHKSYSSKYTGKQIIFSDFSMDLPDKGFISILGKSGCGKTTLLNILGGIDKIDQGKIISFGYDISKFSNYNRQIDEYRKNIVGFVFQNYNLINSISVYENLALPLKMQAYAADQIRSMINSALSQVEMMDYEERMPYELSGGQQQRIAIARAIIKDSKVLLADEPTGNLDSVTAESILMLLKKISKDRLVVLVTHEEEYAEMYSDEIVKLKDGKIVNNYQIKADNRELSIDHRRGMSGKVVFDRSLAHLRRGLFKSILIILLFSILIGIISATIVAMTTSQAEMFAEIINSSTDFRTEIDSVGFSEDDYGNLVISNTSGFAYIETYETYLDLIETYGGDDLILSTEVNIVLRFDDDLSTLHIVYAYMNLLDSDLEYHIDNLEGRMPQAKDEVVISDYYAKEVYGTEDVLGEILMVNRRISPYFAELELEVVGIFHTDYLDRVDDENDFYLYDFDFSGSTKYTDATDYHFRESAEYFQIYTLDNVFDDLHQVHYNPYSLEGLYGSEMINFYLNVEDNVKFIKGDFYSGFIAESDSVIGRLPVTDTEIAIKLDDLYSILPDNETDIQDLIDGVISFDDFMTQFNIGSLEITYDNEYGEATYDDILPDEFTVVGFWTFAGDPDASMLFNGVVVSENVVTKLNENYPLSNLKLSVINTSDNVELIAEDIVQQDFINAHSQLNSHFERMVIFNREGSFMLYRSLDTYQQNILPVLGYVFYICIGFTFILLFLFAYLSLQSSKKQLGIYRSLGFTCGDVIKMYMTEYGVLTLMSMLLGLLIGIVGVSWIDNLVFENTIFSRVLHYDLTSVVYIVLISTGLMIVTSILPLIQLLRMTPVNIVNRD